MSGVLLFPTVLYVLTMADFSGHPGKPVLIFMACLKVALRAFEHQVRIIPLFAAILPRYAIDVQRKP
jgi:hypothetical protein